jgi:hypothetical protein
VLFVERLSVVKRLFDGAVKRNRNLIRLGQVERIVGGKRANRKLKHGALHRQPPAERINRSDATARLLVDVLSGA